MTEPITTMVILGILGYKSTVTGYHVIKNLIVDKTLANPKEEVDYMNLLNSECSAHHCINKNKQLHADAVALCAYIYILSRRKTDSGFHTSSFSESNYWISTNCFINGGIVVTNPNITNFCRKINGLDLINSHTGLASVCMLHIQGRNVTEIAYVTQGTDFDSLSDWSNNYQQGVYGTSQQYEDSERFAQIIHQFLRNYDCGGDIPLYFMGHSLGGGLAYRNAIVTNRPAITFNAASVNPKFRVQYDANERDLMNNKQLLSFYVPGEILSTSASDSVGLSKNGNRIAVNVDDTSLGKIARHSLDNFAAQYGLKSASIDPNNYVQKI